MTVQAGLDCSLRTADSQLGAPRFESVEVIIAGEFLLFRGPWLVDRATVTDYAAPWRL